MADGTGTTTYAYDPVNQTTSVVNPINKTVSNAYDSAGRRLTMTEPEGGVFTYSHDPVSRLKVVQTPAALFSNVATFTYDRAGQLTELLLRDNVTTTYTYDPAGRTVRIFNGSSVNPATFYSTYTFTYDNVGNRRSMIEANSTADIVTWTYDEANQLRNELCSGADTYNITHTYDPAGN